VLRELEEQRIEASFRCSIYLYRGVCVEHVALLTAASLAASAFTRVCHFVSGGEVKFNARSSDASGRLRCLGLIDRSVCRAHCAARFVGAADCRLL